MWRLVACRRCGEAMEWFVHGSYMSGHLHATHSRFAHTLKYVVHLEYLDGVPR